MDRKDPGVSLRRALGLTQAPGGGLPTASPGRSCRGFAASPGFPQVLSLPLGSDSASADPRLAEGSVSTPLPRAQRSLHSAEVLDGDRAQFRPQCPEQPPSPPLPLGGELTRSFLA